MTDKPYADQQDLEFGSQAAEKEELLDHLIDRGESVEQLDADEQDRIAHGDLDLPDAADPDHLADGTPNRPT